MKQRLQKILSRAGVASRRAAEALIVEGRVSVNGRVVTELGTSADDETEDIRVDDSRVRARPARRYVVLHKPPGYMTTRSDPERRRTVMELLPLAYQSLFPVGRLDMGTSGLLLMTDDGEFAHKLTHPKFNVKKTYVVTILGLPGPPVLARATRGIRVDSERLSLERAQILTARPVRDAERPRTRLRVSLISGRNREIRRLFQALGHPVTELHRERIGTLSLRGLPPGAYRPLTPDELAALRGEPGARRARRTRVK